jgi:hypothetical protein
MNIAAPLAAMYLKRFRASALRMRRNARSARARSSV